MNLDETSEPLVPALTKLALDLRRCWNHSTGDIWEQLDPQLWELTQNPWVVLQTASRQAIEGAARDPAFRRRVAQMLSRQHEQESAPAWFQTHHAGSGISQIAYFSMEFMLSEALPIYSGGLGNVAGDQLKAASDLGVPVIGVGLLYQQGYFRQEFDRGGHQQALYPFNDPGQLPIEPVRDAGGEWLRIPLQLPEATIWVRAWQARVGRTRLYLLDTNDSANLPTHRGIASELYGGGPEMRLKQELVLGLCGWRLLSVLGLHPEVCHLNEGHAAFVVLERALSYMQEHGQPFDVALAVTRAGNLFTTHTPVEAGFDRFAPDLMKQYFAQYSDRELRIGFDELMALGRREPRDRSEPFNMAYLATRGSGAVNGVSRLHGEVSRGIFQSLFPRWPQREVPVGHVTNGVHVPTWDSAESNELWAGKCGEQRWHGALENIHLLKQGSDAQLWEMRTIASRCLVGYTRKRLATQRTHEGAPREHIIAAESVFDPDALTVGFARRFATYKRPTLLLHDPERLVRILTNPKHPVQLILAGKAHPQDQGGQAMIKQWNDFIARADVRKHVVFLSDYDVRLTTRLVQGVDLWLNTPRRPWEASGTSGMKVLVNGGLNLSELDGWWAEAYSPEVGWALGDGQEHGEDPAWDAHEANSLYDLLENEVVPTFYKRDAHGIPVGWVAKMRASMAHLTPQFSSNRAVREYVEKYYLPAAQAYCLRRSNQSQLGREISSWSESLSKSWPGVHFGAMTLRKEEDLYVFDVQLFLGELDPGSLQVQLYAESRDSEAPVRQEMTLVTAAKSPGGVALYRARASARRPATDYTPRVLPAHAQASVPLEAPQILWQR